MVIVNSSQTNISPEHLAAVDALVSAYKAKWDKALLAVYIYGSVARDDSEDNSDLDNFAILDIKDDEWSNEHDEWALVTGRMLNKEFPSYSEIKLYCANLSQLKTPGWVLLAIKSDGVLVYGNDLLSGISLPQNPIELLKLSNTLSKGLSDKIKYVKQTQLTDKTEIDVLIKYFSKKALRLGALYSLTKCANAYYSSPKDQERLICDYLPQHKELAAKAIRYRRNSDVNYLQLLQFVNQLELLSSEVVNDIY